MHNPSVLSPLQCSWSSTGISSAFFHPLSTALKIVIIFLCTNSQRSSPPLPLPGFKSLKKGPGAVRNGKRIQSLSPPVQQLRPATSSWGPELSGGFTWQEGRLSASKVLLKQARQAPTDQRAPGLRDENTQPRLSRGSELARWAWKHIFTASDQCSHPAVLRNTEVICQKS